MGGRPVLLIGAGIMVTAFLLYNYTIQLYGYFQVTSVMMYIVAVVIIVIATVVISAYGEEARRQYPPKSQCDRGK